MCAVGPLEFGGALASLVWAVVHLDYLVGFRNRAIVMLEWTLFHAIGRHGARIMVDEPLPPRGPGAGSAEAAPERGRAASTPGEG